MKFPKWIGLAIVILILVGVLAIWMRVSHSNSRASTQPGADAEKHGAKKPATDGPAPRLTLSVNCLRDASAKEGTPLLVEAAVTADHLYDQTIPFVLSKPGGGWGDFASIEVRDAAGSVVSGLNIRPASPTPASISIKDASSGWLAWVVQPEDGKLLAPGSYSVRAVLDSTSSNDSGSWRGTARSSLSRLTVKASSATFSDAEVRFATLVEIRVHDALKENDAAIAAADKYLAAHPKDPLILEEKGDALASAKKLQEALVAYNSALDNIPPQPKSPYSEPPEMLLIKRANAERALQEGGQK